MAHEHLDQMMAKTVQLYQQERLGEAETFCKQILALNPHHIEALNIAGLLGVARGEYEAAERFFRQALAIAPDSDFTWNNLGIALYNQNQFLEAAECFQKTLQYNPRQPSALNNLGDSLNNLCRHEDALTFCQRAVELAPESSEARLTLGVTLFSMSRMDEAMEQYRRAVELNPADSRAQVCLATTLLLQGRFDEGWKVFERRPTESRQAMTTDQRARPEWHGESIEGKTLLVHAEQGIGDNIHFVRYLPMLSRRGVKVVYVCRPEMRTLMATLEGVDAVARGEVVPSFDVQCRIMSLPYLLRTTSENIPREVPYLKADERKAQAWRQRLPRGLNVGIVWAGNPKHTNDIRRSLSFHMLAPLLAVPDVTFVSLQKGPAAKQAENPATQVRWMDAAPELHDLTDAAALIAVLDLVISVDTAMAHLAGALGKPVWTLLPRVPDFRWLLAGSECPWYPTMRLVRQKTRDDWRPAVAEAAEMLGQLAKGAPVLT